MKLHLPVRLFRAVIALMAAVPEFSESAEVPNEYSKYTISSVEDFNDNYNLSTYRAYLLNDNLTLTPTILTCGLFRNGSIYFTTLDDEYFGLTFKDFSGSLFSADYITFDSLGLLNFENNAGLIYGTGVQFVDNIGSIKIYNNDYVSKQTSGSSANTVSGIVDASDISFLRNNKNISIESNSSSCQHSAYTNEYSGSSTPPTGTTRAYAAISKGVINSSTNFTIADTLGSITISDNQALSTRNNSSEDYTQYRVDTYAESHAYGGAVYIGNGANMLFENNKAGIKVENNSASSVAKAVSSTYHLDPSHVGSHYYARAYSYAYSYGGALYAGEEATCQLRDNYGDIVIRGNTVISNSTASALSRTRYNDYSDYGCSGGMGSSGYFSSGNYAAKTNTEAYAYGGAIYGDSKSIISIEGNHGMVLIENNGVQAIGGYSSNSAAYGGAIYSLGDVINIRNNNNVTFSGNYEFLKTNSSGTLSKGTYRLRSIYLNSNSSNAALNLSARGGGKIEFFDPLYAESQASGGHVSVSLNEDYTDKYGNTHKQDGDIIFDGSKAASLLSSLIGTSSASSTSSYTSYVEGLTTLYNGRLIIQNNATYSGQGIVTIADSGATLFLNNGSTTHSSANVNIRRGTSLKLSGVNTISAVSLSLNSGSIVDFHISEQNISSSVLTLSGSLYLGGALNVNLYFDHDIDTPQKYKLLTITSSDTLDTWNPDNVTVSGHQGLTAYYSSLTWEGNTLYFNYDGTSGVYVPPALTKATWSNYSGTRIWNETDENWQQGDYQYAYKNDIEIEFGDEGSGGVILVGELNPGSVLVNNNTGKDYTWDADPTIGGSLTGRMSLTKQGEGTLSIYTDNSYMGDTIIEGGRLVVGSADALGLGTVRLLGGTLEIATNGFDNTITAAGTAEILVQQGSILKLGRKIYNTDGVLTLNGIIDVSALESSTIEATMVDVNGELGDSGFTRGAATGVQLVQGGTVEATGATVLYNGEVMTVDRTGFASSAPTIDYSVYSINDRHAVDASEISSVAGSALSRIDLNSGTLTADIAISNLKATGGTLLMPNQVLVNGTVQDTMIYASAGQLNATLSGGTAVQVSGAVTISGNNTHTGGTILNNGTLTVTNAKALGTGSIITQGTSSIKANAALTLNQAIINTGTLTLSGRYNVSALDLIGGSSVRVDATGKSGASGFLKAGGDRVLVVAGGTVVNNGATVTYNGTNLTLGNDGYASFGGSGINYTEYLLTGTDTATTSAIHSGPGAGARVVQQGGTLTVNDMAEVTATGGSIELVSGGILSGSISGSRISLDGGSLMATLSGNNTLIGHDYALSSLIESDGALLLSGSFDISALSSETTNGGRVDLNGNVSATGNGFDRSAGYRVQLTTGGNTGDVGATITYNGQQLTLGTDGYASTGGVTDYSNYYHTSGNVSTLSIHGVSAAASVNLSGGTLTVNDIATVLSRGGNITVTAAGELKGNISGSTITAQGGSISAVFSGSNTLTGQNYAVIDTLQNTGTLTLSGTFKAEALELETVLGTYVNADGMSGSSGFRQNGGYRVQLVNGGTVINGGATVKYGSTTLTLGSDGYATNGGGIDYSEYLLTGSDAAVLSKITKAGGSSLSNIRMNCGVLTADTGSTLLNATGGTINLTAGTLGGSISGATINASGGVLNAKLSGSTSVQITGNVSLSGSNNHTGGVLLNNGILTLNNSAAIGSGGIVALGNSSIKAVATLTLDRMLVNMGTLTLSGIIDASQLAIDTQSSSYVDVNGLSANSGFMQSGGYRVQVVNGGYVINNGAVVSYNGETLVLGTNGYATSGGGMNYATYYLNSGDSVSVSEAEAASSNALTTVNMTGGTLYADASTRVTATGGNIVLSSGTLSGTIKDTAVNATAGTLSATLSGVTSLSATGTVTISGANTHTAGSMFRGGSFTLSSANALGNGTIMTSGTNTITTSTAVTLRSVILNSGALTMTGTYNAAALSLETLSDGYVDINGYAAESGFAKAIGYRVQVVKGGTVSGGATIKHGTYTLTLGSDGYATSGGGITYSTYYLNGSDSVKVSEAEKASSNALTAVTMKGGMLYADASTKVTATGGNILLSSGTLSGTIKDTAVNATAGTLSATLSGTSTLLAKGTVTISGSNTHTGGSMFNGGTFTLSNANALGSGAIMTTGTNTLKGNTAQSLKSTILNSGTLTLSGSWNLSALALNTQAATYVDVDGHTGDSGFSKTARYEVQVVQGGTTKASNLTLTHSKLASGLQLTLGSNGVAAVGGVVDYSTYYLTGRDSVSVSEAESASGGLLNNVVMSGGNLTADASTKLTATGGSITVTDDATLSGTITNTDITFDRGNYSANISAAIKGDGSLTINGGEVTLSGSNSYTGGTIINGGSLTATNAAGLGAGSVTVNGGTLDLNNQKVNNDISLNNGSLVGNDNYNGNLSIGGDNVAVEGGYTLSSGKVLEIAAGGTEFSTDLTLSGGTLLFRGAPLTVDGEVSFAAGTTTLVDLRSWEGQLTNGLTLAVLGSDVTGWKDGCLELIGMSNMELLFDDSTGSLTLQIAGAAPVAEVITWLGAKGAVWQTGRAGWMNATTGYDAVFDKGSDLIFTQPGAVTIAGAVEPGSVIVAGDKAISFKADKLNPGRIVGEASLTKRGTGNLTLNDGNTYSGGTFIEAGTVIAGGATSFGRGDITISGGTLDLKGKAVANDITLTGAATIKAGKLYGGSITMNGDLLKGSLLNIGAGETATLVSGTMDGALSGTGTVAVTGDAAFGTTAKVTTNELEVSGSLAIGSKGLAMNTKASAITVTSGGQLISEGALKAAALTVDGGQLELHSAKASSIAITNNTYLANGAAMTAFANVKTANLTMENGAQLTLGTPRSNTWAFRPSGGGSSSASSAAALSLTVSGNMNLTSSALTLSGKITAGNLTITDSYVNMTSGKLQTIAVKNTLTLSGENRFIFDFEATNGTSYKLFTFSGFRSDGTSLYELLGWEQNGSYTLTANAKDITLTVKNAIAWENYMDELMNSGAVATLSMDDALVESAGTEKEPEQIVVTAPAAVDPMLGKVADTLVQSTWGTAGASRAFGDTIAARGTHATTLADGKAAAWVSTMGGSNRVSSDGAHAGADYTLTGAAFGMETSLSEKSTVGLAIGNSWGKVSTFSAFPVDQDSTHQGIYGKHILGSSTTLSWMAAHTRTESDGKLAGMACDWTQDALQLDARVDKLFAISDRTTVSAFVGMQYLATDKGECNGLSTGSLQNLRGEIGVSAAHKATDKAYVYGELSFIGDMVRHNPTATVGDYRSRGANPGRAGLNLSVGASYQLNDSWSLNGSYSLELMQNQTSHSANVGATYSF